MGSLEILSPGMMTTVQDLGRPGFEHLGISPSGAADSISFRIGNRLVGNPSDRAALEMTLTGATIRFDSPAIIALTGAESYQAMLDDQPICFWKPYSVQAGQILKTGNAAWGCRSYLCIQNGIQLGTEVPLLFGSASTHIQSGMGGFQGRGLKKGDRLYFKNATLEKSNLQSKLQQEININRIHSWIRKSTLRIVTSIHTTFFSSAAFQAFLNQVYRVSPHSNRLGLRLEGQALSQIPKVITTGVCLGSIQISSNGQPTLLFVEQQLTGGYPQIACVILADHSAIGQLRPGDSISFQPVSPQEALDLFRKQEQEVDAPGGCKIDGHNKYNRE